jgi:crotonobetainyl-CoA:carnitine CoA-transferase CaiB-like acyl-CoA transferase
MGGFFAGIRVIELGASPAVGYAGKLFGDLGANVTRVCTSAARATEQCNSPLALYLHARKKAVAAEVGDEPDAARLRALLAEARVAFVAANEQCYAEGQWSPEKIAQAFPALIVVAVTPFGLKGEARSWPADDLTLQALSGISIGIGLPRRAPLKLPGDQSAFQAGLAAAIAAAGALFSRRGVLIDVSAADVWASFYTGVDVALAHFGRYAKRRAGHRVSGQPYPRTIYRCKDGYFAIQCGESRHWQAFLRMIGREELATHPLLANRFKANDEHGDACDALIEPWFAERSKADILQHCLDHRIPGAPVYDVAEVFAHPHLAERGYFVPAHTAGGTLKLPGHPYGKLDYAPGTNDGAAPAPSARIRGAGTLRPLQGVRVVDFGWVWAGAVPGHILADMGAEVIKVESAKPLDYMRQGRPIVGTQKDPEQNPMFHNVNRGKLSLRIDLDHAEAKQVLRDLIAVSDVVIENFSPGVMQKFGLAYTQLKSVKSDLVMCSMSAVGQEGPLRGIRTYATMIASLAGIDGLVAYPNGRVLGSQSSYADPNASLHATCGILAALWRRERTGEGAYLDVSQWEAAVNVMGEAVADFVLHGRMGASGGTAPAEKSPHGNYPAAGDDRWIAISLSSDTQWCGLRESLDAPAWMDLDRFATVSARHGNRGDLDARLAQETRKYDAQALAARLMTAGVASAPVLDATAVASHPLFRNRALFETVAHPVLASVPVYRLPWQLDGEPIPVTRRAPLLGEHNEYTLQDVLRYSRERVQRLQDAGVFS